MATISFTIPDAQLPRVREAMCAFIGFTAPADVTNANARLGVIQAIKNITHDFERAAVHAAAEPTVPVPPDLT